MKKKKDRNNGILAQQNNQEGAKESPGEAASVTVEPVVDVEAAPALVKESEQEEIITEKVQGPSRIGSFIKNFWDGLILRQFFQKIFSLFFALAVFGAVYFYMTAHRQIMTYMGVMLLMVIVYAEILVIRDHLWVIEGSMRESRKWRDIFFNQTSMRRQRARKILVMIFALGIFSYVYMKSSGSTPILSFMGIILMITILYYEILTIRDEVFIMLQSIQKQDPDNQQEDHREKVYEKFLDPRNEGKNKAGEPGQAQEHGK